MRYEVIRLVFTLGMCLVLGSGFGFSAAAKEGDGKKTDKAVDLPANDEVLKLVKEYLDEKTKLSGTVDLFDSKENKVRNLKVVEIVPMITFESGEYTVPVVCRDNSSGETIQLAIHVEEKNKKLSIKSLEVQGVQSQQEEAIDPNKTYSDEEVQNYILDHINGQAKLTESFPLFDLQKEKLRNLQLVRIAEGVRKYGVLSISSVEFKDKDTQEMVYTDVTVENKKGKLGIQGVRIRKVTKPKS